MITKNNKVFSEVYSILLFLGDSFVSRIPRGIFNTIKFSRDTNYTPIYNRNIPLYEQDISIEALNIIAKLHIDYWCDSHEEKSELYLILQNNEKKANQKFIQKLFNN